MTAKNEYTAEYLMGIQEGRNYLNMFGDDGIDDIIANLRANCGRFPASSPVGQMMRGELSFWINHQSIFD